MIPRLALRWMQRIHPSHRPELTGVLGLLVVLAGIQFVAWVMPPLSPGRAIPYYLVLHSVMEVTAIVIAMMVFAVGWNADPRRTPGNVVLLGCFFFGVASLDLSHTLAYPGMPDLLGPNDSNRHLYF